MIGENLKRIRELRDLGVNELGRLTGLSPGYISSLETGSKKNPSMDALKKIALALEVPVEELLKTDEDIKSPDDLMNPDIRAIARAGEKLSPDEASDLRKLAERLFPDAFKQKDK